MRRSEAGGFLVGDDVKIELDIEAVKQSNEGHRVMGDPSPSSRRLGVNASSSIVRAASNSSRLTV